MITYPAIEFISLKIDWYYEARIQPPALILLRKWKQAPLSQRRCLAAPRVVCCGDTLPASRESIKQTKLSPTCLIDSPFLSEHYSNAPPASFYRISFLWLYGAWRVISVASHSEMALLYFIFFFTVVIERNVPRLQNALLLCCGCGVDYSFVFILALSSHLTETNQC